MIVPLIATTIAKMPMVLNKLIDYSDDEFDHLLDYEELDEDANRIEYADSKKRETIVHH